MSSASDEMIGELLIINMEHKGGTKAYSGYLIGIDEDSATASSSSLRFAVIFRFGKIGASGTAIGENYPDRASAEKALYKKIDEKSRGGYEQKSQVSKVFESLSELRGYIGPVALPAMRRGAAEALRAVRLDLAKGHLKIREPQKNVREEEARERQAREQKAREELALLVENQRLAEEEEHQKSMRESNKNWGLF